ncbi:hypothetical protein THRCLA_00074 [Thraustotheca clavata]|uniref:Importin N-terminal domain-containing protein n=1 Tax=Thraustotheca clavata TaxID=74557 RepID=A0A1W0ACB4_9STRA|nr:hypothetical protein THRCLA_00074 [Thraustotheca clavata]
MDDFIQCCDVLLVNASAGSTAQRQAHDKLLRFQQDPMAWQLVLQVLIASASGASVSEAALFISAQLLRNAIPVLNQSEQEQIRDNLLQFLVSVRPQSTLSIKPVERIVCLALASTIVQIQQDWASWKERLQNVLLKDPSSTRGLVLLLEILSGIPSEIHAQCSACGSLPWIATMVQAFQKDSVHVMHLVRNALVSIPDAAFVALTCLQNWGQDIMPIVEIEFGLSSLDLSKGQLFNVLVDHVISPKQEVSQLAAEIISDTLSRTNSSPALGNNPAQRYESEATIVIRVAKRVLATKAIVVEAVQALNAKETSEDTFMDDPNLETAITIVRGLAKVASTIAFAHSHCVFANGWCEDIRRAESCGVGFNEHYLDYLVLCTSFPDTSVVEETLEFWFFIFEMKKRWNDIPSLSSWQEFLPIALPVVQKVVVLLIEKCQYPEWFFSLNKLTSDHPSIDAIRELRRYIGDALLNIFTNWPNIDNQLGSYMCLDTVVRLVVDSKDLQQVDALLFVLDYMVELFDFDDIDTEGDQLFNAVQRLWQKAIEIFPTFPDHPLLMQGVSRVVNSLFVSMQFDGQYYSMITVVLTKGLVYPEVCPLAAKSLLKLSNSLNKTNTSHVVKGDCIQLLLGAIERQQVLSTLCGITSAYGDFLEAVLRLGTGFSEADYRSVINCAFPRILSALKLMTKDTNVIEVEAVLYLLSRGLLGIRQASMRDAFVYEHWALIRHITVELFSSNAKIRELAVLVFTPIIPSSVHVDVVLDILQTCVSWHHQYASPYVLSCFGVFAQSCTINSSLKPHLATHLTNLFASFSGKLNYDTNATFDKMKGQMYERFQRPTEDLALETVSYFQMLRECLTNVPEVVCKLPIFIEIQKVACVLLSIDHQLPDITDAVCGFFIDVMACDNSLVLDCFKAISTVLMESILLLLAATPTSSKKRCLLNIFYQALQATNTHAQIREVFGAALNRALLQKPIFPSLAPADALLLSQMILGTREKRKFQVLTSTTSMFLQGLGAAPWLNQTLHVASPRSPKPLALNEIIDVMN